jgi:hypothetical protein
VTRLLLTEVVRITVGEIGRGAESVRLANANRENLVDRQEGIGIVNSVQSMRTESSMLVSKAVSIFGELATRWPRRAAARTSGVS